MCVNTDIEGFIFSLQNLSVYRCTVHKHLST